ncbi:MAG: DUF1508 domain-containing protein [Pseudomonadota bacterium]
MFYEIFLDSRFEYRWRLKSANGQIVSVSGEGYVRKASALHGIALNRSSSDAPIRDLASAYSS